MFCYTYFDAIEVQTEVVNLLESFSSLDVMRVTLHLNLTGNLEVVFLLTDKRLVYLGIVESFVSTDYVGWGRSKRKT
jgi:hypothetical protein